jgi:hypothetical protein
MTKINLEIELASLEAADAAAAAHGETTCADCGATINVLGAVEKLDGSYICDDCFLA